jgi:hypothetical protein
VPSEKDPARRAAETRSFGTTKREVLALADWLRCWQVPCVVMEATGDYWKGPFYRLEAEGFECVLADARQVKNLPGRPKRDPSDSRWLAACFERGAVTSCFVAIPEFRIIRLHTRYRRDLIDERSREKNRAEKLLESSALYDRFVAFWERQGMEVLPHLAGASRFGVLAQRLRAGGLVALLCERDLTSSRIEVEFSGEPARIMAGPAAVAEQTGAALMPVTLWYEGENWSAHIHQEIPAPETGTGQEKIAAMTQQLARVFENGIARHPEDWHMLQKVFVADLDTGRLRPAGQQPPPAG